MRFRKKLVPSVVVLVLSLFVARPGLTQSMCLEPFVDVVGLLRAELDVDTNEMGLVRCFVYLPEICTDIMPDTDDPDSYEVKFDGVQVAAAALSETRKALFYIEPDVDDAEYEPKFEYILRYYDDTWPIVRGSDTGEELFDDLNPDEVKFHQDASLSHKQPEDEDKDVLVPTFKYSNHTDSDYTAVCFLKKADGSWEQVAAMPCYNKHEAVFFFILNVEWPDYEQSDDRYHLEVQMFDEEPWTGGYDRDSAIDWDEFKMPRPCKIEFE